MKLRYVTAALILSLTLGTALSAMPQRGPLTREQVVNLVKNQFGDKTGARAIEQRGIDFQPTPDFLDSLKNAGADDVFIQALQNAKHGSQPAAKSPLNQVQVLGLLAGQVPSHRVAMLVQDRGIDFEPKDDFLSAVSRGGGDQELVSALRAAKVIKPASTTPAADAKEAEVRAHISKSIEFNQRGQFAEAEHEIRAALQLWPHDAVILVDLAGVLQSEGKWDESITVAREAIAQDPRNGNAHISVGVALGTNHDVDGAIGEFREALRLDPNDDNAHYNLGVSLMLKNDSEGAIAEYREALRLNPKNAAAHYGLAKRLEFYKSDRKGALEEYRAAYTLSPTDDAYKSNFERLSQELNQ